MHFTPEELFIGVCRKRGRTYELGALDCINISGQMLDGEEFNYQGIVPLIQGILRQNKIRTRNTVISFPVKFPWIRAIEVPKVPQREMDQIVRLEVERLYLDSTVEKLIDYHVLDTATVPSTPGNVNVLSCAIPRNSVAPYIELLAAANLELVGIDLAEVNVLKLAALQNISFDDGISIILNFNMQSTDLMLMENNMLQLVRKVGQGKEQLREILRKGLAETSGPADDLSAVDFTLPHEHIKLAANYVASLLGEIRRSIEFYLTDIKRAEGNVTKVILAGSGYWPTNLTEILALQLHLPLIELRFEHLSNVSVLTYFKPEFPAMGVYAPVVGSVLRGVA